MDEMVDVVDDNNQVLRKAPLAEVHQQGLLHRSFLGLIKDAEDRWLLVKQAKGKPEAGKYVSPIGGHVRAGESAEEALKREMLDQFGIKEFEHQFAGKIIYNQIVDGIVERHHFELFEITLHDQKQLELKPLEYRPLSETELVAEVRTHADQFSATIFTVLNNFYPYLLQV
jgi:ADP-ribose pyrophosphatase YjhB (NUDIX family)